MKNVFLLLAWLVPCALFAGIYPGNAPAGAINGWFSINDSTQVYFSKGNVQYKSWAMANRQFDYIGKWTQGGRNDLFGWGTGNHPTDTSKVYFESTFLVNSPARKAVIDPSKDEHCLYTAYSEWGNNFPKGSNVGNWRTLTQEEWNYVLNKRPHAKEKIAVGQVHGVNGLILLPDFWMKPANIPFRSGFAQHGENYQDVNKYTEIQWNQMEAAGAVFLPAAGSRFGSQVSDAGVKGSYWTRTYFTGGLPSLAGITYKSYGLKFSEMGASLVDVPVSYGLSVRLCANRLRTAGKMLYTVSNNTSYGYTNGNGTFPKGTVVTISAHSYHGCHFVRWSDGNLDSVRTFAITDDVLLQADFEPIPTTSNVEKGYEYVDLGLPSGTLWATRNLGAMSPVEVGNRYAWGEIETKDEFTWATYLGNQITSSNQCGTESDPLREYVNTKNGSIANSEYDAAHQKWGGRWHMPVRSELWELCNENYMSWRLDTIDGAVGWRATSKQNGNSIFLPCDIWSATNDDASVAIILYTQYNNVNTARDWRYEGNSIRPVLKGEPRSEIHTYIVEGEGQITGAGVYDKGDTVMLTVIPEEGYAFGCWSDDSEENPRQIVLPSDSAYAFNYMAWLFPYQGIKNSNYQYSLLSEQLNFDAYTDYLFPWEVLSDEQGYYVQTTNQNVAYSSSVFAATLTVKTPTILSFDMRCTSSYYAPVDVILDGDTMGYYVGEENHTCELLLRKGTHHIRWRHKKYNSDDNAVQLRNLTMRTAKSYVVTTLVNNPAFGMVTGDGSYYEDEMVTLTAIPEYGYRFVEWSNGSRTNPYVEQIRGSFSLQAVFVRDVSVSQPQDMIANIGGVDMGLPSHTLWATCNLGAFSPEDSGDYYAWGETEPKDNYTRDTYLIQTEGELIGDIAGTPYDAAHVLWGGTWTMPTAEQVRELFDPTYTYSFWSEENAVSGIKVVSKISGKCIFLPAVGWRVGKTIGEADEACFWTSTPSDYYADEAFSYVSGHMYGINRYLGLAIRPVAPAFRATISLPANEPEWGITMGSGRYNIGDSITITAMAESGYRFMRWSDGNRDNPRVVVVENTGEISAIFEPVPTGENIISGHEYVDLGLPSGTVWASKNIGSVGNEMGELFMWGEIASRLNKNVSWWDYYLDCYGIPVNKEDCGTDKDPLADYLFTPNGIAGTRYDAATALWGEGWQMPTLTQINELIENTTVSFVEENGVYGFRMISSINENSIFLPSKQEPDSVYTALVWSASGSYWSDAATLLFINNYSGADVVGGERTMRFVIRPVAKKDCDALLNAKWRKQVEKVMINGVLYIKTSNGYYDVLGVRSCVFI